MAPVASRRGTTLEIVTVVRAPALRADCAGSSDLIAAAVRQAVMAEAASFAAVESVLRTKLVATEQQLQFIRRQIQELEQARNSRGPKLTIKTFILVFKFGLI